MKKTKFPIKWLTPKETITVTTNVVVMACFTTIFTAGIAAGIAYLISLL